MQRDYVYWLQKRNKSQETLVLFPTLPMTFTFSMPPFLMLDECETNQLLINT